MLNFNAALPSADNHPRGNLVMIPARWHLRYIFKAITQGTRTFYMYTDIIRLCERETRAPPTTYALLASGETKTALVPHQREPHLQVFRSSLKKWTSLSPLCGDFFVVLFLMRLLHKKMGGRLGEYVLLRMKKQVVVFILWYSFHNIRNGLQGWHFHTLMQ